MYAANKNTIVGNGIIKEKEIRRFDFDAIDTRNAIDVVISKLEDIPVKVTGDENLIDYVEVTVVNGVLKVRQKEGINYSSKTGLKVIIPNNGKIKSIMASGSADIIAESVLTGENLSVTCSGSSDFKGNIKVQDATLKFNGSSDFKGSLEANNAEINCSGSSDCHISGFAENCKISMSGSSDFKGVDFKTNKAVCNSAGSSDIHITCNEELEAKASGSSDIYYYGNAKLVNKSTSGASKIHKK
jgi:hypothetical protein